MHQLHIQHFRNFFWIRRSRFPISYGYFGDRWAFTMWPWPLILRPWTLIVNRLSRDQTLYQILAKSNKFKIWGRPTIEFKIGAWISISALPSSTNNASTYHISAKSADYPLLNYFGGAPSQQYSRTIQQVCPRHIGDSIHFWQQARISITSACSADDWPSFWHRNFAPPPS